MKETLFLPPAINGASINYQTVGTAAILDSIHLFEIWERIVLQRYTQIVIKNTHRRITNQYKSSGGPVCLIIENLIINIYTTVVKMTHKR